MNSVNGLHRNNKEMSKGTVSLILLVAISIFILNENTRSIGLNDQFSYYNIPFLLVGFILICQTIRKHEVNYGILYIVFSFSIILCTYSFLYSHYSYSVILQTIISVSLPLFFIGVKVDRDDVIKASRMIIIMINIMVILLLLVGIVDFLTGGSIQLLMARTIYNGLEFGDLIMVEHSLGIYRYYSFMGHPLANAHYFLLFFILNQIYARHHRFLMNRYVITGLMVLGLLLSASKTALILGMFLVIFCSNVKKNKFLYYLTITIIIVGLFNSPLFENNLKQRYLNGIQSGDITSGRNELLETLLNSRTESPGLMLGGGSGYSREVARSLNGNIFNFEYPIIMLAYDYGITGTMIIYFLILLYPMGVLIRNGSYYELILFLILTIFANSNNGLANLGSDALAQLCFVFFIIRNIGNKRVSEANSNQFQCERCRNGKFISRSECYHPIL